MRAARCSDLPPLPAHESMMSSPGWGLRKGAISWEPASCTSNRPLRAAAVVARLRRWVRRRVSGWRAGSGPGSVMMPSAARAARACSCEPRSGLVRKKTSAGWLRAAMSDGHAAPVAAAPRSYNQSGTEAATAGGGAVAGAGAASAGISGNGGRVNPWCDHQADQMRAQASGDRLSPMAMDSGTPARQASSRHQRTSS